MKRVFSILTVLGALLAVTPARADVVPPPPEDCPDGSDGATCHWGGFCAARTCSEADPCEAGMTCRELALCIETVDCGGWGHHPTDIVRASCEGGVGCRQGACQNVRVCSETTPPEDGGPGDTGPGDTGPGDTGPGDTGPGDTGPGDTGPGDTGPGDTGPGDTGPGDTGPGDTGPGDTGPGDTGPGDTGPGDTGPGDTGPDGGDSGDDGGCDCRLTGSRGAAGSAMAILVAASVFAVWSLSRRRR
jgi:hypothetical protein